MQMLGIVTGHHRFDMVLPHFRKKDWDCILIDNSWPMTTDELPNGVFIIPNDDDYITYIDMLARGFKADFLFSCSSYDDRAIFDSQVGRKLQEYGVKYLGHPENCTRLCANKYDTKQMLKNYKINTPKYAICFSREELVEGINALELPVVIKPLKGWSGHGQMIIKDKVDHNNNRFNELKFPVLIEEFIFGTEISIEVYKSQDLEIVFPPIYKGPTSMDGLHALEKIRAFPFTWDEGVVSKSNKVGEILSNAVNANGWLDIDGIIANGDIYILEINSRFSGVCRLIDMCTSINPYELMLINQIERRSAISPEIRGISLEIPITKNIPKIEVKREDLYFTRRVRSKNTMGYLTLGAENREALILKSNILRKELQIDSDMDLAIKFIERMDDVRALPDYSFR